MDALLEVKNVNDARKLGETRLKGYGHKQQGTQEFATARYAQVFDLVDSQNRG